MNVNFCLTFITFALCSPSLRRSCLQFYGFATRSAGIASTAEVTTKDGRGASDTRPTKIGGGGGSSACGNGGKSKALGVTTEASAVGVVAAAAAAFVAEAEAARTSKLSTSSTTPLTGEQVEVEEEEEEQGAGDGSGSGRCKHSGKNRYGEGIDEKMEKSGKCNPVFMPDT